jgi:hypothetical protein
MEFISLRCDIERFWYIICFEVTSAEQSFHRASNIFRSFRFSSFYLNDRKSSFVVNQPQCGGDLLRPKFVGANGELTLH